MNNEETIIKPPRDFHDANPNRPITLRGHHLLCIPAHIGRGYTPAFTANLGAVIARINAGTPIKLIEGPDDICAGLDDGNNTIVRHCTGDTIAQRDADALKAINRAIGKDWQVGKEIFLTYMTVARLRTAFAAGRTRSACQECTWHDLCTEIAGRGFQGARLQPSLVQIHAADPQPPCLVDTRANSGLIPQTAENT